MWDSRDMDARFVNYYFFILIKVLPGHESVNQVVLFEEINRVQKYDPPSSQNLLLVNFFFLIGFSGLAAPFCVYSPLPPQRGQLQ